MTSLKEYLKDLKKKKQDCVCSGVTDRSIKAGRAIGFGDRAVKGKGLYGGNRKAQQENLFV